MDVVSHQGRSWNAVPLLIAVITIGILFSILYLQVKATVAAAPVTQTGIDLIADRDGDGLQISWNPESKAVLAARSGLLVVRESGTQSTVELTAAGLRLGQAPYQWSSGDVSIKLILTMLDGKTVSESVLWIDRPKPGLRSGLHPVETHLREF